MKYCPTCSTRFTDDALTYCTSDGTVLMRGDGPSNALSQATQVFADPPPTVMMPPPAPTQYAPLAPPNAPPAPQPYGWANDAQPAWIPPAPQPVQFGAYKTGPQQTLAIVSLVAGIAGITVGWICGGPLFGLVAVVVGAIALIQIKGNPDQYGGKPLAIGGVVAGGIVLAFNIILIIIWIAMLIIGSLSH
jgi:Domain of unknown function (DUF4190)